MSVIFKKITLDLYEVELIVKDEIDREFNVSDQLISKKIAVAFEQKI